MRDRNAPLGEADIDTLDWDKGKGLVPAVVQDADTLQVLMLGYMSPEALAETIRSGFVTFFSRRLARLWRKGETSGNLLEARSIHADCDNDAVLVLVEPMGPTCHLGSTSCFTSEGLSGAGWLGRLSRIIADRKSADPATSYTARLLNDGPLRISQKIGEEGVELALAGAAQDSASCIEETADLLYHVAVLMEERGFTWSDVGQVLQQRHGKATA